jgi:predicted O-linked N-acetylglucosamine transferase (SPINDLY family)
MMCLLDRYISLYASKVLAQESCTDPPDAAHLRVFDESKFNSKRALKVGYISYDWRNHPMGRLTSFFVSYHNPEAVVSYAFSYGPDDGSLERIRVFFSFYYIDLYRTL